MEFIHCLNVMQAQEELIKVYNKFKIPTTEFIDSDLGNRTPAY